MKKIPQNKPTTQGERAENSQRSGSGPAQEPRHITVEDIENAMRWLNLALMRSSRHLPKSMRATIPGLVNHALRKHLRNFAFVYPGMRMFARWGNCSERQARCNVRRLEAYRVLQPVWLPSAGRNATEYFVDLSEVRKLLIAVDANPSGDLCKTLLWMHDCLHSRMHPVPPTAKWRGADED